MNDEQSNTAIPPIISVDDHVIEPKDLWSRWLPKKYRETGPRVVRAPYRLGEKGGAITPLIAETGPETDFWVYEDLQMSILPGLAAVGRDPSDIEDLPVSYDDMRPGFYDVKHRLADMDINYIERSLCFPTFPRFCGQTFHEANDKVIALECIRAYNNWMVEEWAGDSGGRLIPLCLIPLWNPDESAREVRRNAERGVHAVAFSELPPQLGLPSIHDADGHWIPFFQACEDTGTVICMHIGSSSKMPVTSSDAPKVIQSALSVLNSQVSLTDWLLSGLLARFPTLRLAFSEGQIGWIPFVLERCDMLWKRNNRYHEIPTVITDPPSSYFRRQVYGCFFEDNFGIRSYQDVGVDNITFESDYPHQDSTWPNTLSYAEIALKDLAPDVVRQIVRDNAVDLFSLPDLPSGGGFRS
jgi:predicted TIM-barrel fold metal-dependent hydrolase